MTVGATSCATILDDSSLRLLGPSSLGVAHAATGLALTGNAAFAEHPLPVGDVFVASQSGSVLGALLSRGADMGVGFAGMVSTGNEFDVSLGEICRAAVDDPHGCQLRPVPGEPLARGPPGRVLPRRGSAGQARGRVQAGTIR